MQANTGSRPNEPKKNRKFYVALIVSLLVIVGCGIAVQYAIHHAQPILRARIVQTLATRFQSVVHLGDFDVSVSHGLDVEGKDLTIQSTLYPNLPPQIAIGSFHFHAELLDLFRSPMRISSAEIDGLVVRVPPKARRAAMRKSQKNHANIKIIVDRILCQRALLLILPEDAEKKPLQFRIDTLTLQRAGRHQAMHFRANLVNPRPIGIIQTEGNFGAWEDEEPGNTPIDGTYSFTHADLSTTKGIKGTLSSTGRFNGKLDAVTVDGTTETPNFSLNVSGHPVELHTEFHAIVNGTNGNTYLQPVHAQLLHTELIATGYVVHAQHRKGHNIHLVVQIDHGRVEDLLYLGVKTEPPMLFGALRLRTHFDLPAGKQSVSRKLRLQGMYTADHVVFTNPQIQKRLVELSLRSQGRAADARRLSQAVISKENPLAKIPSGLHGEFLVANRKLTLPQLVCNIPGAEIDLSGTYTLDGRVFNFAGDARMDAPVSRMVGGWKGALMKPIDPIFARHGAKTEIPITITGTSAKPHLALKL
ncbi:MAG TPA: hypothetical protein VFN53_13455 [Acidobacteriaceae bacterium]|nr:hypothetical protein [Acidobacteriaceae bacterium]